MTRVIKRKKPKKTARVNEDMVFSFEQGVSEIKLSFKEDGVTKQFILNGGDSLWREVKDVVRENQPPMYYRKWWKSKFTQCEVNYWSDSFHKII